MQELTQDAIRLLELIKRQDPEVYRGMSPMAIVEAVLAEAVTRNAQRAEALRKLAEEA